MLQLDINYAGPVEEDKYWTFQTEKEKSNLLNSWIPQLDSNKTGPVEKTACKPQSYAG